MCAIWRAVDHYRDFELLVTVYQNFLRDVYSTMHIYFFIQSHRIINQVINGDEAVIQNAETIMNLSVMHIHVERVVDIVEEIFKTSSALSLLENTNQVEIEYSRLQSIIQSLLSNVNIIYDNGRGMINA